MTKKRTGAARRYLRAPSIAVVYLLIGGSVAIAAATGLIGSWAPTVFFGEGVATLIILVVSVVVWRPSHVWPWAAAACALALFLADGVARTALHTLGNLTASRSILPDLITFPGYALLAVGLLGFSRTGKWGGQASGRHPGRSHRGARAGRGSVGVRRPARDLPTACAAGREARAHRLPASIDLPGCDDAADRLFTTDQKLVPAFRFLLVAMVFFFVGDAVYMCADLNLINIPEGSARSTVRPRVPYGWSDDAAPVDAPAHRARKGEAP